MIASTNCQDITELGGLGSRMPATTGSFLVGGAGLVGLLPLGGFLCFAQAVELVGARAAIFIPVFLITNALTALNLTRVFRQVFLGRSLAKTRRSAEVNWQMALPMVALTVIVLLTPLLLIRLESLDGLLAFPASAAVLWCQRCRRAARGSADSLNKAWSRSLNPILRWFQDLLSNDFYTERFYRVTIVNVVATFSRLPAGLTAMPLTGCFTGLPASLSSAEAETEHQWSVSVLCAHRDRRHCAAAHVPELGLQ